MSTNIRDSFEYHAEEAKLNFQSNLSSLLEISQRFDDSTKDEVFKIIISLGASYDIIDATNKHLNTNNRTLETLYLENRTRSVNKSIQDFVAGKISEGDLKNHIQKFSSTTKHAA